MDQFRKFYWSQQVVRQSGEYPILKGCFAWMIINIAAVGGPTVFVDGWPLNAPLAAGQNGEFHGVGGPYGSVIDYSEKMLSIRFSTDAGAAAFFRQVYYTDIK